MGKGMGRVGTAGTHGYMAECAKEGTGHGRDTWRGPSACRRGPGRGY